MSGDGGAGSRPLSNANLVRVLSPLLLFGAHCLYLVLWSPDPFLKKWIDGSFTFFIALVLCNLIRARLSARVAPHAEDSPDVMDSPRVEAGGDREAGGQGHSLR